MKFSVVFLLSCLSCASAGPVADLFVDALNTLVSFFAGIDGEKADNYLESLADTGMLEVQHYHKRSDLVSSSKYVVLLSKS